MVARLAMRGAKRRDAKAAHYESTSKSIDTFGSIDGVWITASRYSFHWQYCCANTWQKPTLRQVSDGQQTKIKMVYQYLTGPRFRQGLEAIIEKFSNIQNDLGRERQIMMRS